MAKIIVANFTHSARPLYFSQTKLAESMILRTSKQISYAVAAVEDYSMLTKLKEVKFFR